MNSVSNKNTLSEKVKALSYYFFFHMAFHNLLTKLRRLIKREDGIMIDPECSSFSNRNSRVVFMKLRKLE